MDLKITPLALGLIVTAPVVAQPTIDLSNNQPLNGQEFVLRTRPSWTWEGPAGADVMYAFWDMVAVGTRNYRTYDASVTPSAASIPTANMVSTDGGADTLFWNYASDGLYQVGARTSTELLSNYSDPILEIKYPCTFGTTWSDVTAANYTSPVGPAVRTGTITGIADGYGALGVSEMDYPSVLRVHVRRDFSDAAAISARRITNTWYYLTEDRPWPVMKLILDSLSINGGNYVVTRDAQWMGGPGGVGVGEVDPDLVEFIPYPNPTNGRVDLSMEGGDLRSLEVLNVNGQVVSEKTQQRTGSIGNALDLSGLPAGVYQIRITRTDGRTGTQRVVLQ